VSEDAATFFAGLARVIAAEMGVDPLEVVAAFDRQAEGAVSVRDLVVAAMVDLAGGDAVVPDRVPEWLR
jgi:hypothetical protein